MYYWPAVRNLAREMAVALRIALRYCSGTLLAMGLLRTLFWVLLFLVSTFAFTVLFEYGPSNYASNAKQEWQSMVSFYHAKVGNQPAGGEKKP